MTDPRTVTLPAVASETIYAGDTVAVDLEPDGTLHVRRYVNGVDSEPTLTPSQALTQMLPADYETDPLEQDDELEAALEAAARAVDV